MGPQLVPMFPGASGAIARGHKWKEQLKGHHLRMPQSKFAEPLRTCYHKSRTAASLRRSTSQNPSQNFPANYPSKEPAPQQRAEVLRRTTSQNPSLKQKASQNLLAGNTVSCPLYVFPEQAYHFALSSPVTPIPGAAQEAPAPVIASRQRACRRSERVTSAGVRSYTSVGSRLWAQRSGLSTLASFTHMLEERPALGKPGLAKTSNCPRTKQSDESDGQPTRRNAAFGAEPRRQSFCASQPCGTKSSQRTLAPFVSQNGTQPS